MPPEKRDYRILGFWYPILQEATYQDASPARNGSPSQILELELLAD